MFWIPIYCLNRINGLTRLILLRASLAILGIATKMASWCFYLPESILLGWKHQVKNWKRGALFRFQAWFNSKKVFIKPLSLKEVKSWLVSGKLDTASLTRFQAWDWCRLLIRCLQTLTVGGFSWFRTLTSKNFLLFSREIPLLLIWSTSGLAFARLWFKNSVILIGTRARLLC